eukprot:CAMPEP_0178442214 /NCGR_PEP_ID=MMETSP0689_2-20121128/38016_1 /TAXON_ID=160604 /ORGANISM="Amphidinium massartii, Strain CS-259" /LENGTH=317 /DNA_ID=CAMNT_0020065687 /DNA_START=75 /DNA_END=1025 /DNA_ORIENTATION=+
MSTVAPPYFPVEPVVRPAMPRGGQLCSVSPPYGAFAGSEYRAGSLTAPPSMFQLATSASTPQLATATVPWPPPPLPPCELSFRIDSLEARTTQRGNVSDMSSQVEQLRLDLEAVEAARVSDRSTYNKLRAKHLELIADRDQRIRVLEEQISDFRVTVTSVEDLRRQLLAAEERNVQLSRDFEQLKKVKFQMEQECEDLRSALSDEQRKAGLLQSEVDSLKGRSQQSSLGHRSSLGYYSGGGGLVQEQVTLAPAPPRGGFGPGDGMITVDLKGVDDGVEVDVTEAAIDGPGMYDAAAYYGYGMPSEPSAYAMEQLPAR